MIKRPAGKVTCCDCGKKREAYWPIYLVQREVGAPETQWCCRQCFRDKDYSEFMTRGPVGPQ